MDKVTAGLAVGLIAVALFWWWRRRREAALLACGPDFEGGTSAGSGELDPVQVLDALEDVRQDLEELRRAQCDHAAAERHNWERVLDATRDSAMRSYSKFCSTHDRILEDSGSALAPTLALFRQAEEKRLLGDRLEHHARRTLREKVALLRTELAQPPERTADGTDAASAAAELLSFEMWKLDAGSQIAAFEQALSTPWSADTGAALDLLGELLPAIDRDGARYPEPSLLDTWNAAMRFSESMGWKLIYPAPGDPFIHGEHTVVRVERGTLHPENTVVSVDSFGYRGADGTVLRPTSVVVAQ